MGDPPLRGHRAVANGDRGGPRSPIIRALANARRRAVLAVLADERSPITEQLLAARVDAHERPEATERHVRRVRTSLLHVHLPVLADVRLVDYTPDGVEPTDRFDALVRTCPIQTLLDDSLPFPSESVDRGLALLAHDVRRQAIEELAVRSGVSVHELAATLATGRGRAIETDARVDRLALELHHVHVPALVDAAVVERDGSDLHYLGDAFLEAWWFSQ